VEEGRSLRRSRPGFLPESDLSKDVKVEEPGPSLSEAMLSRAILSVRTDKRPKICFLCLGNPGLRIEERTFEYSIPGCLTKHFMRSHVKKVKNGEAIDWNLRRLLGASDAFTESRGDVSRDSLAGMCLGIV
jgi:hypothetical protein